MFQSALERGANSLLQNKISKRMGLQRKSRLGTLRENMLIPLVTRRRMKVTLESESVGEGQGENSAVERTFVGLVSYRLSSLYVALYSCCRFWYMHLYQRNCWTWSIWKRNILTEWRYGRGLGRSLVTLSMGSRGGKTLFLINHVQWLIMDFCIS